MARDSVVQLIRSIPHANDRDVVEQTVRAFLGSYPARTIEEAVERAELLADDVVFEDPVGHQPVVSKAAMIEFFKGAVTSGLVITLRAGKVVVSGDEAICFTEGFWGPAGGTEDEYVHVDIIHNFVLDANGKIARVRVFFDEGCVRSSRGNVTDG